MGRSLCRLSQPDAGDRKMKIFQIPENPYPMRFQAIFDGIKKNEKSSAAIQKRLNLPPHQE